MAETQTASDWVAPTGKGHWSKTTGREMVEAWRQSGESQVGFARRHGLGAQRVKYWIDRVESSGEGAGSPRRGRRKREVAFAPVRVVEAATESDAVPLDVVIGAAVVRVPPRFDEAHLRRVVRALGGGAC